jgi:hypothetical protein
MVGISVTFFVFFINSFALPNEFNLNNFNIRHNMYRHIFPGFIGSVLIIVGITESWANIVKYKPIVKYFSFILICGWVISGNLIIKGINNSKEPKSRVGYSHWQTMAESIQYNDDNICVPINPYGWIYSRNCKYLNKLDFTKGTYEFFEDTSLDIDIPNDIKSKQTIALLVNIDSANHVSTPVELYAYATTSSGEKVYFYGFNNNVSTKSTILLNNIHKKPVSNIIKLELTSNIPLKYWIKSGNDKPSISWLGK